MSEFLAVTAFHSASTDQVIEAISQHLGAHGVASIFDRAATKPNDRTDAQVYSPVNGWAVVLWPEYFNVHDFGLARAVATRTGWLVSSVHVYDSQYWEHLCVVGDRELHIYNSRPAFWKIDSPDDFVRISRYESDPRRLAAHVGVPVQEIAPYFVNASDLADPNAKSYADDECALGSFWVFTDFWRRLGIRYPDILKGMAGILRLDADYSDKLPAE